MDENKVVRLPLWRSCLEDMQADGLQYGKTFTVEWFEGKLRSPCKSVQFGIGLSHIRQELEKDGFYLNGSGVSKNGLYIVQQAQANVETMHKHNRRSRRYIMRQIRLGHGTLENTLASILTTGERKRIEQGTHRAELQLLFMRRSESVKKALGDQMQAIAGTKRLKE